ncbi:MAG: hypothetical protein NZ519_13825, partial [Bacteroidia bacterium]|nr:hypothetical protein [Bacteroidia bacterium]
TGYAIASVLRFAPHRANARPPHASRKLLPNPIQLYKIQSCNYLKINLKQGKINFNFVNH